ncbi:zinc-binding alcohol dehydrogenase family protein [Halomonas daqiaonensis]|uniref:2-desacetyl-2-hydroxyethyl bacteriochlorophyllide A dehydrogenase n=1 Tax=Halomonas daqiaonensis TaxID=650850 RepID=A0A1H7TSA2_9GAMM|nr:zinc-binding alcohol dehydrogenase family protein [Halomonas daqiaonensis]SEL87621.1 2-desacetyl-2-hydroxyethyl bacteriochlorophyllide A dehydrogenase [Halomonas daqiaonensis]
MRSVVCTRPGLMECEERKAPSCGAGEAVLRIRRIGICGTDIHAYGGNQPYFSYPRVLGHELAGEIVEVGDGRDQALVGQNASLIPYLHCGECRACRKGLTNCCQHMQVIGVHRDGGMCDLLVVPTDHLITSSSLSLDQLALMECLAIGAHAVRRSELDGDSLAVVVGAGPIGMGVVQFARESGARVVVIDPSEQRLAFCRETLGIELTLNPMQEDPVEFLASISDGAMADVVFDASGNAHAMQKGFDFVGHGGHYVLVSIVKSDITFNDPDFHRREMTLLSSRNATREDFDRVASLMAAGRLQESAMITHRAELTEVPDTMPRWCDPSHGVIKAMVQLAPSA